MAQPDLREPILARLAVLLGQINLFTFAGRNLIEVDESRMPSCILYDGDETAWDNPAATFARPGTVELAPIIEITMQAAPEAVGSTLNDMLAQVKKKLLNDVTLDNMCNTVPGGGVRYVATMTSLSPARSEAVKMLVHFTILCPFIPKLL